jgi:hypothetical protein
MRYVCKSKPSGEVKSPGIFPAHRILLLCKQPYPVSLFGFRNGQENPQSVVFYSSVTVQTVPNSHMLNHSVLKP